MVWVIGLILTAFVTICWFVWEMVTAEEDPDDYYGDVQQKSPWRFL